MGFVWSGWCVVVVVVFVFWGNWIVLDLGGGVGVGEGFGCVFGECGCVEIFR